MGNAGCCNDLITTKCFNGDSRHWDANFNNDTTSIGKLYDYVNGRVDVVVTGEDFRTSKEVASEYKIYTGKEAVVPKLNHYKDWSTHVYVFGRDPKSLKNNGQAISTSQLNDSGYVGFLDAPCKITSNEFFVAVAFTGNQGAVDANISGVIPQSRGTIYSGSYDGGDTLINGQRYKIAINYNSGKTAFGDAVESTLDIHNRYATYSADKGSLIDKTFSSTVSLVQMSHIKHVFGIRNQSGLYVFIDNGSSIVRLKDNLIEGYLCYNNYGRQSYLFNPNDQTINIISTTYPVGYNVLRDSSGFPQRFVGPRLSPQESGYRYASNDNYDYINDSITTVNNNSSGLLNLQWGSGLVTIPFGPWNISHDSGVMAEKNKVESCIAYSSGNTGYAIKDRLTLPVCKDYGARNVFASENNQVFTINPFSFAIKKMVDLPDIDTAYAYEQAPKNGILKTPEVLGFVQDAPLYSGYLSYLNDNIDPTYEDNIPVSGGFNVFYDDAVINRATENEVELIVIQPYVDSFVEQTLTTNVSTVVKNTTTTDEVITYNSYQYDYDCGRVNNDVASGIAFSRNLETISSQVNGLHINGDKIYVTYSNTFSFSYYSNRITNQIADFVGSGDSNVRSFKRLFQYNVVGNSGYQIDDINGWYDSCYAAAGADFDEAVNYGYISKWNTRHHVTPEVSWLSKLGMTNVKDMAYGLHVPQHSIVDATDGDKDLSTTFSVSVPGAKVMGGVITSYLWGLGFSTSWKNKITWVHNNGIDYSPVTGYADLSFSFVRENYPLGFGYNFAVGLTDSTLPFWSNSQQMYELYSAVYNQIGVSQFPDGNGYYSPIVEFKYTNNYVPVGTATAPYYLYDGTVNNNRFGYYPRFHEPDVTQTYEPNSYKSVEYPEIGIVTGFAVDGYADRFDDSSGSCEIAAPVIMNGYWGGVRTLFGSPDENVCYFDLQGGAIRWGSTVANSFVQSINDTGFNTHPNGWWYNNYVQQNNAGSFGTNILPINLTITPTDWAYGILNGQQVKDHNYPIQVSVGGGLPSVSFPCEIPSIQVGRITGNTTSLQYGFLDGNYVEAQRWNLKAKDYIPLIFSVDNIVNLVDDIPEASALTGIAPWIQVDKIYGNNIVRSCVSQWYYDAVAIVIEERVAIYDKNYKLISDEAISSKYDVVYPSYGPSDNIANFYIADSSNTTLIPQEVIANSLVAPLPPIPASGYRTYDTYEVKRNPSGVVPPFYAAQFDSYAVPDNNPNTGYLPVNLIGSFSTDKSMAISDKTAYVDMTPILTRYNTLSAQVSGTYTMELDDMPPYPSFLVNGKEKYYYPNAWVQPADSGVAYLINKDIGQWLPTTTDIRAYSVKDSAVPTVRYITDAAIQVPASGFASNTEMKLNVNVSIYAYTLTLFVSGTFQWVYEAKPYSYKFDIHSVTPDDISSCISNAMDSSELEYSGVNTIMDLRYGGYIQTAVEHTGFYSYWFDDEDMTIRSVPVGPPIISFSIENFTSNLDNIIARIPSVIGFNDSGNCNNIEFVSRHYSELGNDGLYRPDFVNGSLNLIYSEPIDVTRIGNSTFVTGKLMSDQSVPVASKQSIDFGQHHALWEGFVNTEKTNKAQ